MDEAVRRRLHQQRRQSSPRQLRPGSLPRAEIQSKSAACFRAGRPRDKRESVVLQRHENQCYHKAAKLAFDAEEVASVLLSLA